MSSSSRADHCIVAMIKLSFWNRGDAECVAKVLELSHGIKCHWALHGLAEATFECMHAVPLVKFVAWFSGPEMVGMT